MQSPDDTARLMRAFCESGDPAAFRALVARFLPLVFAAGLRRGDGDAALAEDVAQHVFADFARRMPRLRADDRIGAWLYRAAHLRAGDVLKSERRRKVREQQAAAMQEIDRLPESEGWQALSHVLDEALARLRVRDREVLVLRFLDGLKLDALAHSQGISTAAAQKRVERALERLREKLGKSGIKGSVLVLSGLIASRGSSEAAPAMVERVASRSLESLAASGAASATNLISLPIAATSLLVVFGAGTLALSEKDPEQSSATDRGRLVAASSDSLIPKVSARTPRRENTLEEIIDALGEIFAKPLASLDDLRRGALFARIPEDRSGDALALMDAKWNATMLMRANYLRKELHFRWGERDPEAASDWLLAMLAPGSERTFREPGFWTSMWQQTLVRWAHNDWATAWGWVTGRMETGLRLIENTNVEEAVALAFGPGLIENLGLHAGLDAMLSLQDLADKPDYAAAIQTVASEFKDEADFRYLMDLIDARTTAPRLRVELKGSVLAIHGKQNWEDGLAWVKALPDDWQRAQYGWTLGFPVENAPPGFNATAHADWLFALHPGMSADGYYTQLNPIMEQWLTSDPGSAAAWLRKHDDFLNHRLANGIVSRLPVFAARSDGDSQTWLKEAESLLRQIAAREGKTVRSYWSDAFFLGPEDPEIEAKIEAFLEQASAPQ